jgi:hypothetical protein
MSQKSLSAQSLLLFGSLVTFALLVLFKLHGYSLPAWHLYIDGSAPSEVIVGKVRTLRADDFVIELPLTFAQEIHQPPFPTINDKVGQGAVMALPLKVPIAAPVIIFRPELWGFFISPDTGLAWDFAFMVVGLFVSIFLVLQVVTRKDFFLSLSGSLLFLMSSHFPLWSFHKSEIVIFGGLAFFSATKLLSSSSISRRLAWGVALGWCLGSFFTAHFYPPLIVVMTYAVAAVLLAYLLEEKSAAKRLREPATLFSLGLATVIALFAAYEIIHLAGDAFSLIRETKYPGARATTGGELDLWRYFTENFLVQYLAAPLKWGPLANASEAGSFILFAPFLLLIAVVNAISKKQRPSYYILLPSLLCVALLAFGAFGFPLWLAKLSLLSLAPSKRVIAGLGFASIVSCTAWVAVNGKKPLANKYLIFFIYIGLMLPLLFLTKSGFSELSWPRLLAGFAAHLLLIAILLSARYRRYGLVAAALLSAPLSLSFNPLVHGGYDYLVNNSLSLKIKELQATQPRGRWLVIARSEKDLERSLVLSNLPRILGVDSVGGFACPPDTKTFALINSNWRDSILNECGHTVFILKTGDGPLETKTDGVGKVFQDVRLKDSLLKKLNVRYAILVGVAAQNEQIPFPAVYHGVDLDIVPIPQ